MMRGKESWWGVFFLSKKTIAYEKIERPIFILIGWFGQAKKAHSSMQCICLLSEGMLFKIAFTTSSAIWMDKVEQTSLSVKFKMALTPMLRLYLLKQSYLQKMQNAPEKNERKVDIGQESNMCHSHKSKAWYTIKWNNHFLHLTWVLLGSQKSDISPTVGKCTFLQSFIR